MDIGESLFGWLWKRAVPRRPDAARKVPLGRLEALGTILAGRPWRCAIVRDFHRAPPVGWTFLDPAARAVGTPITEEDANGAEISSEDLLRILFGTTAYRMGACLPAGTTQADANATTARCISAVIDAMCRDFPAAGALVDSFEVDLTPQMVGILPQAVAGPGTLMQAPSEAESADSKPTLVALKTRPPSGVENDDQKGDMPLQHVFEKAMTADEYVGGQRTLDGEKDGSWSNEVLAELEVDRVIRTGETAQGYAESAYLDLGTAAELKTAAPAAQSYPYPEWFEGAGTYKPAWCSVIEERASHEGRHATPTVAAALSRRECEAMARQLRNRPEWRRRLLNGEELDLQAVVDWRADVASGTAGAEGGDRVYQSRHIVDLEAAVAILVDKSLSTDTWVTPAARQPALRVLDAFKATVLTYGDVLEAAGATFEVAAFNSRTRHQCRYEVHKDFSDRWHSARAQVAALEAADYTRLGPAIRHAATRLGRVSARRRLLLVLSDAKPTDYDAYEGRHGMADVKRAAQELAGAGVKLAVITLSRGEARLHARIFPNGIVRYADSVSGLCRAMHAVVLTAMKERGRS